MKRLLLALCLVVAAGVPAAADPTGDVRSAMTAFARATSFHISASFQGNDVEADMIPPTKAHFVAGPVELITIDGTTWMKFGGGWHQFTVPGMDRITGFVQGTIDTMRNPPDDLAVTDLGMKTVDGVPLHAYAVATKTAGGQGTLYLDRSGMIARIDNPSAGVIRFSKYNAPLIVQPPS